MPCEYLSRYARLTALRLPFGLSKGQSVLLRSADSRRSSLATSPCPGSICLAFVILRLPSVHYARLHRAVPISHEKREKQMPPAYSSIRIIPRRIASAVAWARSLTASFWRTLLMCRFTVSSAMRSSANQKPATPISVLVERASRPVSTVEWQAGGRFRWAKLPDRSQR